MGREGLRIQPKDIDQLNEKVIAFKQMTQFGGFGILEFDSSGPDDKVIYRYYDGTKAGKKRVSQLHYTRVENRPYFIADNSRQHLEDFLRTDLGRVK